MVKELVFKPNEHDRVIYSAIIDIKNHVYKAKSALELSKIDQENLRLKVNEWAANDTKNKFFHPYTERPVIPLKRRYLSLMHSWKGELVHHKDFMVIQMKMTTDVKL